MGDELGILGSDFELLERNRRKRAVVLRNDIHPYTFLHFGRLSQIYGHFPKDGHSLILSKGRKSPVGKGIKGEWNGWAL
ncbi:hypothetical protein NKI95_21080 [Mesorhizobium sp. M0306]|uniref:hypothetical protein n=1 Tax=Mesorhizobium sp. M0306 TaxID=2956932 RepID=UPI003339FAC4